MNKIMEVYVPISEQQEDALFIVGQVNVDRVPVLGLEEKARELSHHLYGVSGSVVSLETSSIFPINSGDDSGTVIGTYSGPLKLPKIVSFYPAKQPYVKTRD